LLGIAVPMMQL